MVFIMCFLASQLSCSGGHYVVALGLSAAGELGWDGFFYGGWSLGGCKNCIGMYRVAFV